MTAGWMVGGIVTLVVGAIAIEAYLKRNRRRPLADMRPRPRRVDVLETDKLAQDPMDHQRGDLPDAEHRSLKMQNGVRTGKTTVKS